MLDESGKIVADGLQSPEVAWSIKEAHDAGVARRREAVRKEPSELRAEALFGENVNTQSVQGSGVSVQGGETISPVSSRDSADALWGADVGRDGTGVNFEKSAQRGAGGGLKISPTLLEDISAAINIDRTTKMVKSSLSPVSFSSTPRVLNFVGMPEANIISNADRLRKMIRDHNLSVEQIADFPNQYANPVAIFKHAESFAVITSQRAANKHGDSSPVVIYLRPVPKKNNFVVSAYPMEQAKIDFFEQSAKRSGALLYLDAKKASELNSQGGLSPQLRPENQSTGFLTPEGLSEWKKSQADFENNSGVLGSPASGGNTAENDFQNGNSSSDIEHNTAPSQTAREWPADFPKVTVMTSVSAMKKHADYAAAKAGDRDAARRLVFDVAKDDRLVELAKKYPNAIVVPVHAEERAGTNQMPSAFADHFGRVTRLEIDRGIVQTSKAGRTGNDADYRMVVRSTFAGRVKPGHDYILVDDVATMGGTLSDLRDYIEANGGNVVHMSTLAAAQFGTTIALSQKTKIDLFEKYDENTLDEFLGKYGIHGGRAVALTEGEARWFIRAGSLNAARNRFAAARSSARLRGEYGSISRGSSDAGASGGGVQGTGQAASGGVAGSAAAGAFKNAAENRLRFNFQATEKNEIKWTRFENFCIIFALKLQTKYCNNVI